jgi:hypothetical protein
LNALIDLVLDYRCLYPGHRYDRRLDTDSADLRRYSSGNARPSLEIGALIFQKLCIALRIQAEGSRVPDTECKMAGQIDVKIVVPAA